MKNIKIYLLCTILCFAGCKTVKRVLGIGGETKTEQTVSHPSGEPQPSESVPVTTKTIWNLVLYCVITLVVLGAVRLGVKKWKEGKEE